MRTWSPNNTYGSETNAWTQRCNGKTAKEQTETTCPHKLKSTWLRLLFGSCLLFGPCAGKGLRKHTTRETHPARDSDGDELSGAKCQHHASQNPPSVRRNSSSSKRQPDRVSQKFRVELVMCSHATGRLILPCGVSTDSPRHQTFKCCHALSMSTGSNISQRAGNIGCCIPGEESNTRKIHSFKF